MQIGRALLAAIVAIVATVVTSTGVVVSTGAAQADPAPAPDPGSQQSSIDPSDVVILHTDTAADTTSDALRTTLDDLGATVRHTFGSQHAVSVELPAGTDAAALAGRLEGVPGVAAVEPGVTRSFTGTPNDSGYAAQRRYLDAVAAPAAWDRQHGSAGVTIAVVDSGVDVGHPDLAGKIAGTYNAVTGTTSVTDTLGHGTFVAGVAAARTNNSLGVAGAGYDTRILAVKVADSYGDIAVDDEVAGIRWAATHGASIINLSLSGTDPSTAEQNAIRDAQRRGVLVVAAAGNDGNSTKQYPAAYPGVVAVGATDVARNTRAAFSSYGPWVTLAAPGVGIYSTTPRARTEFDPNYAYGDGTSFSTPLVAGEAALLKAQNPKLSVATLRAELVASAHGYGGLGLGAGQVDFALGLRHVVPTGVPTEVTTTGTAGPVTLSAKSTAARVRFRVDDTWLPTVPAAGGVATTTFDSAGWSNAAHHVQAVDCTEFAECNYGALSSIATVDVDNPAPVLTVDPTADGPFTAGATAASGGLRLLVDGKPAGFAAAAPYTFMVNASLYADGAHTLTVQSCTVSQSRCDGPTSAPASVAMSALHPTITPSRAAISPNGDGSGDTAALTLDLGGAQDAKLITRNAAGTTVRTDDLAPGTSTWTWSGKGDTGATLPDGAYTIALVTTASTGQRGLAERVLTVDTLAPRLSGITGNGTLFYPAPDGYRDTFAPTASLPDGGRLTLTISTLAGRTARMLQADHTPIARTTLPWNGRTTTGRPAPAGTYRWRFTAEDAAGNKTLSPDYRVSVSAQRLRTQAVSLVRTARTHIAKGSATCAGKTASSYRHGLHLINRCSGGSGEVAYAVYVVTLPSAYRYGGVSLSTYGRAARTSRLGASFQRTDGALEVPRSVRVTKGHGAWRTIASVPVAGHVTSHRTIRVTVLLSSRYANTNDFDARSVRLRVTLTRLQ